MFSLHWFYSLQEKFNVVLEKDILQQVELATIYSTTVLHFSLITNTFSSHCWRLRNDSKEIFEADPLHAVSTHCSVLKSTRVSTNGHVVVGVNIIPLQSLSPLPKLPDKGQAFLIITLAANIILHLFYFRVCTMCCYYTTWWISEWFHFGKEAKETKSFYYFHLAARGYFEIFCNHIVWEVSMRVRKKINLQWNVRIEISFRVLLYIDWAHMHRWLKKVIKKMGLNCLMKSIIFFLSICFWR